MLDNFYCVFLRGLEDTSSFYAYKLVIQFRLAELSTSCNFDNLSAFDLCKRNW